MPNGLDYWSQLNYIKHMKIKIEDYFGNDICSFVVNESENNNGVNEVSDFVDCNYADMDTDEYSEPYIRIQLENESLTLFSN